MQYRKQPRIGISTLSFFPRFLIPIFGYWSIFRSIKQAGMGVQLTPTRCLWISILSWILPKSVDVISLETAFPHENARDTMGPWYLNPKRLHWAFMKIDGYWPVFDLVLFSARRKRTWKVLRHLASRYPGALQVDTRGILDSATVSAEETSPKNADSLDGLLSLGKPLVLDTYHIRQFKNAAMTEKGILSWIETNKTRFVAVQLQPDRKDDLQELAGLLRNDRSNFLVRVVKIMKDAGCPFVFEFSPKFFLRSLGPTVYDLIQLRESIERAIRTNE